MFKIGQKVKCTYGFDATKKVGFGASLIVGEIYTINSALSGSGTYLIKENGVYWSQGRFVPMVKKNIG